MRAVLARVYEGRPLVKVVSVQVVYVSVAVIVFTRRAVQLGFVHPHVVVQVLMIGKDTGIHDSHDHARVAGTVEFPCLEQIDVRSRHGHHFTGLVGHRSVVVVMPLQRQTRIIERHLAKAALPGGRSAYLRRKRTLRTVERNDPVDRLHMLHAGQCGELLLSTGHGYLLAELHIEPKMKSPPAMTCLETGVCGEHHLDLGSTQAGRHLIEPGIARSHIPARKHTGTQRSTSVFEADPHPTGLNEAAVKVSRFRPLCGCFGHGIPHTRRTRQGRRKEKQCKISFHLLKNSIV